MASLVRGAYDRLLTEALGELLLSLDRLMEPAYVDLRPADASDRIALHVSRVIERALDILPDDKRVELGFQIIWDMKA